MMFWQNQRISKVGSSGKGQESVDAATTQALVAAKSNAWTAILAALVAGYDYHINVRMLDLRKRHATVTDAHAPVDHAILKPTWTDLTMWAVLIGKERLVRALRALVHAAPAPKP